MKPTFSDFTHVMIVSFFSFSLLCSCNDVEVKNGGSLYDLGTTLESRSASFENPTGEPGRGGMTASKLGTGRKGFPAKSIVAGETVVLCDVASSGSMRL